ncbi:MAG: hypothetical protein VKO39_02070 [Cyanobacteriota bacterium]|nr:hypothetical protein [Cyanobacteriota bacterium]
MAQIPRWHLPLTTAPPGTDRLAQLLGPAASLLQPAPALLAASLLWLVLSWLTGRWLALAWCCWSLVLLATAVWLERPWVNRVPLPPLTVLTLAGFQRWGLGALLLVMAGDRVRPDVVPWIRALEPSQALWGLLSTAIVAVALANRSRLRRLEPAPIGAALRRRVPLLVLLLGLYSGAYLLVGVISGTLDRSNVNYVHWTLRLWRADTVFVPFLRLKDLFYLLVPLGVQTCLGRWPAEAGGCQPRRWLAPVLVGLALSSLVLAGLTGGRGLLLAPLSLLLLGLWMTDLPVRGLRWLVVGFLVFALAFIPLMGGLRDTPAFQTTHSQRPLQRLGVIARSALEARPKSEDLSVIGRDLFPSSDPFLFQPPGSSQPPTGWKRLHGLAFLWVPKHFYPNRPEINDGHLIAKEIMGQPMAGTVDGKHVWFPNVSFAGDLYWRFRAPGVVLGALLFAAFYALLCRLWYRWASLNGSLFAFLIAIYPATFLNGLPLRSVSETVWNWFWDFPKYLLVLVLVAWLVDRLHPLLLRPTGPSAPSVAPQ